MKARCNAYVACALGEHGEDTRCCLEQGHEMPHELFPIQDNAGHYLTRVQWALVEEWE